VGFILGGKNELFTKVASITGLAGAVMFFIYAFCRFYRSKFYDSLSVPIAKRKLLFCGILVCFFLRGFLPGSLDRSVHLVLNQHVTLVARIQSVTGKSLRLSEVKLLSGHYWKAVNRYVYIKKNPDEVYNPGDWVGLNGQVVSIDPVLFVSVYLPRDVFHYPYVQTPADILRSFGSFVSRRYFEHLSDVLPKNETTIAAGIFLGKKFEEPLQTYLNESGLGHLFVVSGLHFFILFQIIWLILSFFSLRRSVRTGIAFFILAFFWIMTGCTPSSSRAFVLLLSIHVFKLSEYPSGTLNLLGVTAIILLLSNRLLSSDTGFQLSFLATIGIFCGSSFALRAENRFLKYVYPLVGALVFTTPVTLLNFGRMPFLSIPFNIFFVSVVSFVLLVGIAVSFLCFIIGLPAISGIMLRGLSPVLKVSSSTIEFLGTNGGTLAVASEIAPFFFGLLLLFFFTALSIRAKPYLYSR
jgi:ComEC/Rec2-related protein